MAGILAECVRANMQICVNRTLALAGGVRVPVTAASTPVSIDVFTAFPIFVAALTAATPSNLDTSHTKTGPVRIGSAPYVATVTVVKGTQLLVGIEETL